MVTQLSVSTHARAEMLDITSMVQQLVQQSVRTSGTADGVCHVFVPHTTAGITINEHADPDVSRDLLTGLERMVPWDANYHHMEGNAAAHIKASVVGSSVAVFIEDGRLLLGTWQGIFFCEFDGPRNRKLLVSISPHYTRAQ